jgi:hypothetical protein
MSNLSGLVKKSDTPRTPLCPVFWIFTVIQIAVKDKMPPLSKEIYKNQNMKRAYLV